MATEAFVIGNEQDNKNGSVIIAPEVIEVIIGIAAAKVDGVYGMRGGIASNVNELFGRAAHGKGVTLSQDENGVAVELFCYLNYGVTVPKVALEMQEKVKEQVLFMTDIELAEVNVHVVGVVPEKIPAVKAEKPAAKKPADKKQTAKKEGK
ncbi:Asp23/Gls24 family envelope stress response protein [Vagococcus coleopterorum]|uniref:Asp23/Gls24 family envelope stress response protein n=1 Tax=Vagococcus coleopterorum TaxID=2714946 RepID=A0A6G8AKZ1_9ENTE|nr:Asp23/Gls24 family envelope stress response protein [Vagococcus coleopterorum]QIL45595.1 Asp23/Gls24 family envelope stress response protein [Vagococcus coleopterorum]